MSGLVLGLGLEKVALTDLCAKANPDNAKYGDHPTPELALTPNYGTK